VTDDNFSDCLMILLLYMLLLLALLEVRVSEVTDEVVEAVDDFFFVLSNLETDGVGVVVVVTALF